ncbi:MAG: TlpA family protein disulfide reductase [Bacilli bacterium]
MYNRIIIIALTVFGLIAGIAYFSTKQPEVKEVTQQSGLQNGMKAPTFEAVTLDGDVTNLDLYNREIKILTFWTTWCENCKEEFAAFNALKEKYGERIEIIAVNWTQMERNKEAVKPFVEENKLNFPVLLDQESDISSLYEIQALPTSYVIMNDGTIKEKVLAARTYDQWVKIIETHLN